MGLLALLLAVAAGPVDLIGHVRGASPASLTLTLRAVDRTQEDLTVSCPVAADASFRCSAPAGVYDIRVAIPGFLPVYRWGLQCTQQETTLGDITAQRSSSIAGWVVDARQRRPIAGATVELLERTETPVPRQSTKSNARGFFQFVDVDPGSYGIRVTPKGASPAHVSDVVVREMQETLIKDIAVAPLSRLAVSITPPVRSPEQEWKIELSRNVPMTAYTRVVARAFGGPAGTAQFDDLESGFYHLSVRDSSGTTFANESFQVDVDPPPLVIRISAVPIRGRVKAGGDGVKARVEFSNGKGPALRIDSDDNGDFAGLLPADGQWLVGVVLPSKQDLNLHSVEVKRRDTDEYARIDLDLPAGRLEGRVVDERGNGVSTAVRLTRGRTPESAMLSDGDGHFAFIGLTKSDAIVDAGNGELSSGPVPVSISEEGPPVTITVRKSRKLKGWLTTPAGYPVVGAAVRYWTDGDVWGGRAMSNPSGIFELTLPTTARTVGVFVAGAGIPVVLRRLPVPDDDERIHVVTAPVAGRLLIPVRQSMPPYPVIARDGVTTTLDGILWPGQVAGVPPQGSTPEGFLVDVEPGRYSVCLKNSCKTVDVAPATQMKVDVYE